NGEAARGLRAVRAPGRRLAPRPRAARGRAFPVELPRRAVLSPPQLRGRVPVVAGERRPIRQAARLLVAPLGRPARRRCGGPGRIGAVAEHRRAVRGRPARLGLADVLTARNLPAAVAPVRRPFRTEKRPAYLASTWMNDMRHEDAHCI